MERVIRGSGGGSTLSVVETPFGRLGPVVRCENYMPLLRSAMYARGVELYCAITVDDRDTWRATVAHIPLEGRCFVLSACQFDSHADLPPGYPTGRLPAGEDAVIRGGSCIIGPLGQPLAGPVYGEECILTADLDMADLARAKRLSGIENDRWPMGYVTSEDGHRMRSRPNSRKTPPIDHRSSDITYRWIREMFPDSL